MDRTAMFEALRPFAPGGRLKPEWVPHIDVVADLLGLPRFGWSADPDLELIAAFKLDEGLRLKAIPTPFRRVQRQARAQARHGLTDMAAPTASRRVRR